MTKNAFQRDAFQNNAFQITSAVGASLGIDAPIRQLASSDLAFDAAILENLPTQVSSDLGIDYSINSAAVGANLGFSYKITKAKHKHATGQSLRIKWQINKVHVAGKSLGFTYGIDQSATVVGAALNIDYEIVAVDVAGAELAFDYSIPAHAVGADLAIDYEVSELAGADLDLDAPIRDLAGADLDLDYELGSGIAVGTSLGIDYSIQAHATQRGGGFEGVIAKRRKYRWVEADLYDEWSNYAEKVADLQGAYLTKRAVGSELSQSWAIRNFIDAETAVAWSVTSIDRVAEWNRKILLGEIDEDLMVMNQ